MSIREWASLCSAAGINVRNLEPMDVYVLAGKIINDSELTEKARELCPGSMLREGIRVKALSAMRPDERIALRERVTGVVPFRKSK